MKTFLRIILLVFVLVIMFPLYALMCPKGMGQSVKEITKQSYLELGETDEMYLNLPYKATVTQINIEQLLGDAQVTVFVTVPEENLDIFTNWLNDKGKQYSTDQDTFCFSYFLSDEHTNFGERKDNESKALFGKIYWSIATIIIIVLLIPFEKCLKPLDEKMNMSENEEGEDRLNRISLHNSISDDNIEKVLKWTNNRNADFLRQYAGDKWKFPLTKEQMIQERSFIYSIYYDNHFIGIVEILNKENTNVHIGRFLLNPDETGKGFGTKALMQFCNLLFEDTLLESITLNVYAFNISAKRCYEKCGFNVFEDVVENGIVTCYKMKKTR